MVMNKKKMLTEERRLSIENVCYIVSWYVYNTLPKVVGHVSHCVL